MLLNAKMGWLSPEQRFCINLQYLSVIITVDKIIVEKPIIPNTYHKCVRNQRPYLINGLMLKCIPL
jgi:hypothetical protein